MPWKIQSLTVGWPPNVTLTPRVPDKDVLHALFAFLSDKRVLLVGYGGSSGIDDVDDLAVRIDALRARLLDAVSALPPGNAVAEWLHKLQLACHELLGKVYEEQNSKVRRATEADIAPAVDEMRDAFQLLAARVAETYDLPTAARLRDAIAADRRAPDQE